MDEYDPSFVPNTSDDEGRYAYNNQPTMVKWNLQKLAIALSPILPLNITKGLSFAIPF